MRTLFVTAALIAAATAFKHDQNYYLSKFYAWMDKHNVKFENGAEFVRRLEIFSNADDIIEQHNSENHSYKMGHNKFSYLTWEEFSERLLDPEVSEKMPRGDKVHEISTAGSPSSWDWSTEGAVTGVKDQGSCGSCWAFSTTGTIEGAYYQHSGNLVSFSEQQIVSCDSSNSGCNGGWPYVAVEWASSNGGLCTEADYPYTSGSGADGTCQTSCSEVSGSAPSGYVSVDVSDAALQDAVYTTPVSVCVYANNNFMYYESGVFTSYCPSFTINHAVLAVGYGTLDGTPYWKVKNSWGTSWGEEGYILLERDNSLYGKCGILSQSVYPTY